MTRSLIVLPLLAPIVAVTALAVPAQAQFSQSFNFLKAVREADGQKATDILNKPGSAIIDVRDPSTNEAAIHIVTRRRDLTWLSFMLSRGAARDLRDGNGDTALMIAAQLGWIEGVQLLVQRRASVDTANARGETALIRAVQNRDAATVRVLLGAGANPNKPDNAAGLSAKDYAKRDLRSAAILKLIEDIRPAVRAEAAGPR